MSNPAYHTPGSEHFARTNRQTIAQRAALIQELLPGLQSIGELCCGDCPGQADAYRRQWEKRGLEVVSDVLRAEALAVYREYALCQFNEGRRG